MRILDGLAEPCGNRQLIKQCLCSMVARASSHPQALALQLEGAASGSCLRAAAPVTSWKWLPG